MLGGFQIDDKLELFRLLDEKVGLGSLENFIDIAGGTAKQVRPIQAIRHKATHIDGLTVRIYRGKPDICCKRNDPGIARSRACTKRSWTLIELAACSAAFSDKSAFGLLENFTIVKAQRSTLAGFATFH